MGLPVNQAAHECAERIERNGAANVDRGHVDFSLGAGAMMAGIAINNNIFNHLRMDRKTDLEASRLQAGLSAELHALLDLYDSNIRLLDRNCDYLLSSRSLVAIYKGNLARVTALLDADVIGKLVASFALNEMIESLLTARAQPKGGSSYKIAPSEVDFKELRQMYENAARSIVDADRALDGDAHLAEPARSDALHSVPFVQTCEATG